MYDELLERVKAVKPNPFDDTVLECLFEEAAAGISEEQGQDSGSVLQDNVLFYYVLARVSLFCGDMEDYESYRSLYNRAAAELQRKAFEESPADKSRTGFYNIW